jgi:two-component system sensor kinase FixL
MLTPHGEDAGILAAVTDASDDAIIITDLDGIVVRANRGATRLYGYASEEMAGRSIALLMTEGQRAGLAPTLQQIRDGERIPHLDAIARTKQGRIVELAVSVSPVRDATGRIVGAAVVARDVTHDLTARVELENRLRSSEARWRAVIESAVDGIVVIDAAGLVEALNPAAERLFGYAEGEVVGNNVSMLMPEPYRSEHNGYLARYLREGAPRIIGSGREVTGRRRDGSTFPLHLSVGEMSVAGERKFTGILHDLSARVRMEEQLREQAAMVRLGEMAAVIAHEVKNPLAGVRGAIQVIGGRLPRESKDALIIKEIIQRIDALSDLMKDLLLFARPPQPRPSPTDLVPLVEITADLLSKDPSLRNVEIEIAGSAPPIHADPEMLKIVFQNLLVNGAHAMHGQGRIRVAVQAGDSGCEIAFSDTGPGIPHEIRDKIFAPFFTTKSRGSGLGLPTAKRLIEAHKGRIVVECPAGGGTTVIVQIPAQPA